MFQLKKQQKYESTYSKQEKNVHKTYKEETFAKSTFTREKF